MKKIILIMTGAVMFTACNINVDTENRKDSTTKVDSFLEKADTTLEKWGDSAKSTFKHLKEDVKDRFRKDSSAGKLQ